MTDAMVSDTAKNKYNMMSVPFEAVDGKGVSLNEINFANATYTTAAGSSDIVMFWKPEAQTYEQYYYYGVKGYETQLPPTWRLIGASAAEASYDYQHPEGMEPGTVFWYQSFKTASAVNQSMTSAGAVASDPYETFTITHKVGKNTYYFISNPYPSELDVTWDGGQVVWSTDATYSTAAGSADIIMVWDAEVQNYVQYYFYGVKGYESQLKPAWRLVGGTQSDVLTSIPAGTGFWYYAYQATGADKVQTIQFNSPLK